jgi:hypothetical protein
MSGNKHRAAGDLLKTFGSIWHLVVAHVSGATGTSTTTSTMTTTTTGYTYTTTPGY